MKKNKALVVTLSVFSAMAVASLCAACGGQTPDGVTLDRSAVQMDRYERTELKAEIAGEGAVVWSSSDDSVATVDANGVITSLKEGETTVTATVEGVGSAECTVTVVSSGKVPVLAQGWETKEVSVGAEIVLEYTLTYKDANVAAGAEFTCTVGNPAVLSKAADGTITAIAAGESTVTLSASYCGWTGSAEYTVTVAEEAVEQPFAKPEITLTGGTVSWTAVDGATSYTLKINDTEFGEVTGTSIDLTAADYASALVKGNNTVTLKVNAAEGYLESPYSDAVTYVHKVAFAKPVLSIDGTEASWTASDEAESYTLKIGTTEFTVTENTVSLVEAAYTEAFVPGNNAVSVKVNAVGNNLESEYSDPVNFFYHTPFAKPEITLTGSTVSWTAVDGATSYTLKINETEFETVTGTSIDLTAADYASALVKGNNTVTLKVNTTDEHLESPYSDEAVYVHKVAFAAPVIELTGSTVSWTAAEEAESYTLTVNGDPFTVTETSIDLTAAAYASAIVLGENTVSVIVDAVGNNLVSAASNTVTYVHKIPFAAPVIALNESTVSWTAVEGASGYTVTVNGDTFTVTDPSFDLFGEGHADAIVRGENAVTVKANAAGNYLDSAASNEVTYEHYVAFTAPVVTVTEDTVSWTAVPDATGYTLKIGGREFAVTDTSADLLAADYAEALVQGNNTVSVKVNANGAAYWLASEYSAAETYFYRSPLEKPVNVAVNNDTLSWDAVEGAESYTLKINDDTFENLEVTSVNLLAAPYFDVLLAGEDNEISVKANATETRRESEYCEPVAYDPVPQGTIIPTAERVDTDLTYLPSYEGMDHVFRATIGPNREVMVLDDIATKYPDKDYVYFDIWMPEDFGTLVGIAYCTGDSANHSAACEVNGYRHTSEGVENGTFNETYSTICLWSTMNEKKVVAGWNTIAFRLSEHTKVGVGKHSLVSTVYIANIRFTELRTASEEIIAPTSPNSMMLYDNFEGRTNVFLGSMQGGNNTAIKILDNAQSYVAEGHQFVYFDVYMTDISRGFTGLVNCVAGSASHEGCASDRIHNSNVGDSVPGKFTEYSTIKFAITTNDETLVAGGWNTVKVDLTNQNSVSIRNQQGGVTAVYVANIRFEP